MKAKKSFLMWMAVVVLLSLTACGVQKDMNTEKKACGAKHGKNGEKDMTSGDGGMMEDDSSMQMFPAFTGKDLEGNDVNSKELFSGNAVTVINFWFTTCGPCVGELTELDALNKELKDKGGMLVGVNAFTLGGDETAIAEAVDLLKQKDASYQNIYFDKDSEAGDFAETIEAFPTTYVIDRNGNIVGEPVVGAVTAGAQKTALMKMIDETIEKDMK